VGGWVDLDMSRYIILLLLIGLAWGQDCTASDGTDGVTVFGNCYSIENTTTISIDIFVGGDFVGDTIPSAIGLLTNLTTLQLRGALRTSEPRIGNVIPPEIGNLTNLEILDLTDNEFGCHRYNWLGDWATDNCNELCSETDECNASIPPEIGNLTNLKALWLTDNHLSGEIPSSIGNLVNLRSLGLGDNDLTGSIPSDVGNLIQLHVLDMADNQLGCYEYDFDCEPSPWYDNRDCCITHCDDTDECSGEIPSTIGNMTNLGVWNPTWYDIQYSGPDGQGMDYWPALNLKNNQFTGPLPSELENLTDIEQVNLSYNYISGSIPPEIGNMTSLIILELNNNQLNNIIPPDLANLNSISKLWLSGNNLRGQIPEELCNIDVCGSECNNSTYVFSGNNFCPPYPECFTEMNTAENTINIINNQLCNPYPDCPAGHTAIAEPPPINGGQVYDGWCFNETDLENLQAFIDVNESLSGEPIEIGEQYWTGGPIGYGYGGALENSGYGSLNRLDFSNEHNEISIIPESIGNLEELEFVDFSNTQITTIPAILGDLSELSKIWWENGQLTGFIPPELGNLTNLTGLKLNDNQLTGSIPAELGNTNLHYLYLNRNQLTGEVPLEIWNLEAFYESGDPYEDGGLSLRTINLRHNQLTGVIPESICDLNLRWNHYNFVDIRNNKFCPPYPSCLTGRMGSQNTSDCD